MKNYLRISSLITISFLTFFNVSKAAQKISIDMITEEEMSPLNRMRHISHAGNLRFHYLPTHTNNYRETPQGTIEFDFDNAVIRNGVFFSTMIAKSDFQVHDKNWNVLYPVEKRKSYGVLQFSCPYKVIIGHNIGDVEITPYYIFPFPTDQKLISPLRVRTEVTDWNQDGQVVHYVQGPFNQGKYQDGLSYYFMEINE
ncbi:hypothetical protein Cva_00169 [Caedimonas varicaedens]|uniref:Uncharacterized protein n=1 Tax=Caedimonas varicaedens TaxID=1629334 RepID=A0A0K8MCD3_9PROT|nr:hypothetical protein Cva_00169 [Caedimonas varicaedens]